MKGIDSLSFRIDSKDLKAEVIETLLKDICAESVELNFSTCQRHVVELAQLLVAYFEKKDYDLKKLQGSINYDYFNKMLVDGKEKGDLIQTAKSLIEAVQPLPFYRVLNVNELTLNNAGAYISQELGYALAWGKCIECRKEKARNWRIRLAEELKNDSNALFITLTFNEVNYQKLAWELFRKSKKSLNYTEQNEMCKKAVRRWLERIRKKTKRSIKHWLVIQIVQLLFILYLFMLLLLRL